MSSFHLFPALGPREVDLENESASAILDREKRRRIELNWMITNQEKLENLRREAIVLEHSILKRMLNQEDSTIPQLRSQLDNQARQVEKELKVALDAEVRPKKPKKQKKPKKPAEKEDVEMEDPEEAPQPSPAKPAPRPKRKVENPPSGSQSSVKRPRTTLSGDVLSSEGEE